MDKRSLWQRKALKGSRLRLLIWGVLAAFLVVDYLEERLAKPVRVASMISQFIRPATRLRPAPISVRRNCAFRPASLLGLDELESRVVPSVTLSVTAAPFYADPSGVKDSSAAIQNCMNAVHAAGGGAVSFPAGTYKISLAGSSQKTHGSLFTVPSNITFTGAGQSTTKLLMAPNEGDYNYIFDCQADHASNVTFQNITIDQNGLNAGGNPPSTSNYRTAIIFTNGTGNLVQRCHFTNIVGVWAIAMFGAHSSVTIKNNTFDNVGLNTTNMADIYDHSTIYTDAANITITGNTFTGRLVNGTTIGAMGATNAIEIHGYNQNITNNTVSNYSWGVNVASSNCGFPNNNQFYQNNTFTNVGTAFALWPYGTLSNCSILNNNITIDVRDWTGYWGNSLCGIYESPFGIGPTNGLTINNNTVTVTNYSTGYVYKPSECNGISLRTGGTSAANTNLTITNNHINNSLGAGIYLDAVTNGLTITGNVITNPGSSATTLSSADRSAIRLLNNIQKSTVKSNTFIDGQTSK